MLKEEKKDTEKKMSKNEAMHDVMTAVALIFTFIASLLAFGLIHYLVVG